MRTRSLGIFTALLLFLACLLLVPSVFADSQVRIVRLSTVDGGVLIDRNTGQGFEKAFLNLPITQGTKLQTRLDGRAEVEFEDGSTVRLTPGSVVEFPTLSLRDSGGRASTLVVRQGTVYLKYSGKKEDEFTLQFARERVRLTDNAELRLQMDPSEADLAVFKGAVQVENASGIQVAIGKKQTGVFELTAQDRFTLAKNVEEAPFDDWNKQQEQYHDRYLAKSSYNGSPYSYGMSDLNYYGSFFNAPGYGMLWQPYFAGAGWDPFMNGSWAWYPGGMGYTWVSAYPWGWMPYYYGSWLYVPSYGWAWQPGNSWAGFNRFPVVNGAPGGFITPQAPMSGHSTLIVNRGPVVSSTFANRNNNKMVVRGGSAGLGIPRGSLKDPGRVSQQVREQGAVTTRVQAPARPATSMDVSNGQMGGARPSGSISGSTRSTVSPSAPRGGYGGSMGGGSMGGSTPRPSGGAGGGRPPR